ncbi:MAG TPA: DNA methyltransferase [Candidatus Nanoarchaeia archaeon]|nr:DNA methyltransferase [Candidatus Nanoarchaeia archaeon]
MGGQVSLELMDRVQFIYELALAKLELEGLSAKFEATNSMRKFNLLVGNQDVLKKRVAYFKKINGTTSDYERLVQFNQTTSINQYLTHWIYPYKGKFHPQMIRALINFIQVKGGETILDPFIGSGTTALESQVLGINSIGIDVSPVCVLISKVKTQSIGVLNKIKEEKTDILKQNGRSLMNFDCEQKKIRESINRVKDKDARDFFLVAELIAHSDMSRRKRDFSTSFSNNVEKMINSVEDFDKAVKETGIILGAVKIEEGDSRNLKLKDNSIDGIITSPPYSIALDYVKNDAHALEALGFVPQKIREEFIGVRGTNSERIAIYNKDLAKSIEEMFRVLKPGKFCVIIIGDATYLGEKIKTVEFTIHHAEKSGFKLAKNLDKIIFGLYNIMQKENILIFKKP